MYEALTEQMRVLCSRWMQRALMPSAVMSKGLLPGLFSVMVWNQPIACIGGAQAVYTWG